MKQVAPLSFPPFLFLSFAAFLAYAGAFPFAASSFAWIGGIKLFNTALSGVPFARLIHWLHAMTFEFFALVGVALLRLIPIKGIAKGNGRPILLIHGYMNHSSVWFLFKKRLESFGFGPVYTMNLGHPFHSIEAYAEKVKEKARQIETETGRKDLILIGHSMGGLVSSFYAATRALPNTVTDVITLGSPLYGTPVAYIGIGPNAKEMRPTSEFLKTMREAMSKTKGVRFFHIATKSDQLVIPGKSAILPENEHFLFEDLGHASLLYSQRAAQQVAHWLQSS